MTGPGRRADRDRGGHAIISQTAGFGRQARRERSSLAGGEVRPGHRTTRGEMKRNGGDGVLDGRSHPLVCHVQEKGRGEIRPTPKHNKVEDVSAVEAVQS